MATPFTTTRVCIEGYTSEQVGSLCLQAHGQYGCDVKFETVFVPRLEGDEHDMYVVIHGEYAHMFEGYEPDAVDDDGGNLGQPSISHATGTARQNICDHLWYLREIAKHHGIGHLALDGDPVSIDSCLAGIGEALNSINDSVSNWK